MLVSNYHLTFLLQDPVTQLFIIIDATTQQYNQSTYNAANYAANNVHTD